MMTQSYTSDDLKQLFGYPFQDIRWKHKFLIGSLVVLAGFIIPLIPFCFVYGYMAQIMRRIIVEEGDPYLPEWDDWGQLFMDGLKLLGAILLYSLPIIVLFFAAYILFFAMVGLSAAATGAAESAGEAPSALVAIGPLAGILFFCVAFAAIMILSLAIGLLSPAIMGHVVATNEFSAAFRIREWWSIFRANIGGFLIAYVVVLAISVAFSFGISLIYLTIILCCFLPFILAPATVYMLAIYGVVFAEAYRAGVQKLEDLSSAG
jgi:hypothetical protein